MAQQRLPIVNSDDGTWGDIIRQYLMKEHFNDDTDNQANGGHQFVTIRAGNTAKAPLTLSSGSLLSSPAIGAIEFNGDKLYFTQTTGAVRKTIAAYDDASGATGDVYYRNSGGNFTRLGIGSTNQVLTVSSGLPTWQAPSVQTTYSDVVFTLQDASDATKQVKLDVPASQTTGTTRTITLPAVDSTLATLAGAETLTNKTLVLSGVASPAYTQGKLAYDTDNESLTFYNNDSNVSLQVGQEEWVRVINNTGATIPNGSAVYISGASSGLPTIALARADAAATTICAGLATESISNNSMGFITSIGLVRGFDTSGFTAGQTVFLSASSAGALTSTAPVAPNYRYRVGIVGVSNATTGTIHVTPSTAALGNGSANQLFGMNNAGSAQEVKSIVGTSNNISVAHSANTITLDLGSNAVTTSSTQTLTNKTLTNPKINNINDTNGSAILGLYAITSAVNYFYMTNQSLGNYPTIGVDGSDTNIGIAIAPKGNGPLRIFTGSGQVPTIEGIDGSGNTDLNLKSNGTGKVKANNIEVATISGTQTLTNKTLTTPVVDSFKDSNGNTIFSTIPIANAVNNVSIANASAGVSPSVNATGSDSNIHLYINPKGNAAIGQYVASGVTPTFFADGVDANLNLNLASKGTGKVTANGTEVATISSTQTLTNKRITPRVGTIASSATPSVNTDTGDHFNLIPLSTNVTSFGTSGTPTDGQKMMIRIKDDGTARTIVWSSSFQSSGVATLLSTTAVSKTHHIAFVYDAAITKWVCLAVDEFGY